MSFWTDIVRARIPTLQKSLICRCDYEPGSLNGPHVPLLKITWTCGFSASYWIATHRGVTGFCYTYDEVNTILIEEGMIFAKEYFRTFPEFQGFACLQ